MLKKLPVAGRLLVASCLIAGGFVVGCSSEKKPEATKDSVESSEAGGEEAAEAAPVHQKVPKGSTGIVVDPASIDWDTNEDAPIIGNPDAPQGGTWHDWMGSYPLTFRLQGPDSNDSFAGWNRSFTMDFSLVRLHPVTDEFIPCLATHWKVMDDNQTIYYKLDPDARWSDGEKITAHDFEFCYDMMLSPHIVDPFYNTHFDEYYSAVEAVDDYTLRIVGKRESWRPLYDYGLWPMPRHIFEGKLDENWVRNFNLQFQVAAGPYVIKETENGQRVVFERIRPWWGDEKRYFKGLYNVDKIDLMVVLDSDRALDHFKKGELSHFRVTTAKTWAQDMEFESIQKGWVHKKRVFIDYPQGLYGFAMNLQKPIFQNKDFRKAVQYGFDFDEINKNLMFNAYFRAVSAFEGTEYENPNLKPYGFDPAKVREHLAAAGYKTRGKDGIFQKADGSRAAFTLMYGQPGLERHFTVVKQKYAGLGIDVQLQQLEPGTAFQRGLEREYEMTIMSRTTNLFPSPHQYFASEYIKTTNNNNIWAFGTPHTDELIDVYRFDMDKQKRIDAMWELDSIIQDEAFYAPFWQAPFVRLLFWDYVVWPDGFFPRRFEQITDWQVMAIDTEKEKALAEAMKSGKALVRDEIVDVDRWGVKAAMVQAGGN
ncbi:MAG: ABC transporter substrate-binding protein [Candidatus Eisenbacteria bacterium]|uniref:ABC transporter substrate-binding protein n=1 Tax=Eiseniibacteriota bacterium TaxID=2212470 RepID=A0A956SEF7_UNCEI|nr:ABC transporter substrate-binding protein [Candidatus Eisenbacteria bacterium]MCB9465586.1 ABC transporter substrate-binding protein [Candidatus Eisenbacteria bacterium]